MYSTATYVTFKQFNSKENVTEVYTNIFKDLGPTNIIFLLLLDGRIASETSTAVQSTRYQGKHL